MRHIIIALLALLSIIGCTAPSNPYEDPANFQLSVRAGGNYGSDFSVGDTLELEIVAGIPSLIHSAELSINDQEIPLQFSDETEDDTIQHSFPLETRGPLTVYTRIDLGQGLIRDTTLTLQVSDLRPGFEPRDDTALVVDAGTACTLSVLVKGRGRPYSIQWLHNGKILAQATSPTHILAAVNAADTGRYRALLLDYRELTIDTSHTVMVALRGRESAEENRMPQWENDTIRVEVAEGQLFEDSLARHCSDPDGDTLSFTMSARLLEGDSLAPDGHYRVQPDYDQAGVYSGSITAADSALSASATLLLTVVNTNRPPAFEDQRPASSYTTNPGEELSIPLEAQDPDADEIVLFVSEATLPRANEIELSDSALIWEAMAEDEGAYTVLVGAHDGEDTAFALIDIGIGQVNLPPRVSIDGIVSDATIEVAEGDTLSFSVTATDPNTGGLPTLRAARNLPFASASNGDGSYDTATGEFRFVPSFSLSSQARQDTLPSVTFFAVDRQQLWDSITVTITVKNSNRPPVATGGQLRTTEETALQITLQASDPDDDALTWSILDSTTDGALSGTPPEMTYTPDAAFSGDDTLRFRVSDGDRSSDVTAVIIRVSATNDAPTAADTAVVVDEDSAVDFRLPVADEDGDQLIILITRGVDGTVGELTVPASKVSAEQARVTYQPKPNKNGTDLFRYQVSDGESTSREATVSIQIRSIDDAPTVSLVSPASNSKDISLQSGMLRFGGEDNDGDGLSYTVHIGTDSSTLWALGQSRALSSTTQIALLDFDALLPGNRYYWGVVVADNSKEVHKDTSEIRAIYTDNTAPQWKSALAFSSYRNQVSRIYLPDLVQDHPSGRALSFTLAASGEAKISSDTLIWARRHDDVATKSIEVSANDTWQVDPTAAQATITIEADTSEPDGMRYIPAGSISISGYRYSTAAHFFMDTIEVTVEEYEKYRALPPLQSIHSDPKQPIGGVKFAEMMLWCNAKSKAFGYDTCYSYDDNVRDSLLVNVRVDTTKNGFRVPFQSEWVIAMWHGTFKESVPSNTYYWGEYSNVTPYEWSETDCPFFIYTDPEGVDHKQYNITQVAQKLPNFAGLYDMAGNALEFVWSSKTSMKGSCGTMHVMMGGRPGFSEEVSTAISGRYANCVSNPSYWTVGFRCIRRPYQ